MRAGGGGGGQEGALPFSLLLGPDAGFPATAACETLPPTPGAGGVEAAAGGGGAERPGGGVGLRWRTRRSVTSK